MVAIVASIKCEDEIVRDPSSFAPAAPNTTIDKSDPSQEAVIQNVL